VSLEAKLVKQTQYELMYPSEEFPESDFEEYIRAAQEIYNQQTGKKP